MFNLGFMIAKIRKPPSDSTLNGLDPTWLESPTGNIKK